jgi:hypothetical protein
MKTVFMKTNKEPWLGITENGAAKPNATLRNLNWALDFSLSSVDLTHDSVIELSRTFLKLVKSKQHLAKTEF